MHVPRQVQPISNCHPLAGHSRACNSLVADGLLLSHREIEKQQSAVNLKGRVARLAASEVDMIAILRFGSHMVGPWTQLDACALHVCSRYASAPGRLQAATPKGLRLTQRSICILQ